MACVASLLSVLAIASAELSSNLRGHAFHSLAAKDCSQFCCWWPQNLQEGECGSCGDDFNQRTYPAGCSVPCTGANCGAGKAHQYFQTSPDWESNCKGTGTVCAAPSLALPASVPAPAPVVTAEVELASSGCSQFCCWWPQNLQEGECGSCGDDFNQRTYPAGCSVPCTGANCGAGKAHQYFQTSPDWESNCKGTGTVCAAPSLALPASVPAPAPVVTAEVELASTGCSQFCCWWPQSLQEGECGSCGDDFNHRTYPAGCCVPCTGANCGAGKAHQYFQTSPDWESNCKGTGTVCRA